MYTNNNNNNEKFTIETKYVQRNLHYMMKKKNIKL